MKDQSEKRTKSMKKGPIRIYRCDASVLVHVDVQLLALAQLHRHPPACRGQRQRGVGDGEDAVSLAAWYILFLILGIPQPVENSFQLAGDPTNALRVLAEG